MSRERADAALIEEVERELRRALAIEPSPEFAQRVRMRIGETSRSPAMPIARWLVPLTAAAACVLAMGIGWRYSSGSPESTSAPLATRVASDVELRQPPARVVPPEPLRLPARPVRRGPVEPDVIVPPERARALARMLALARSGVVDEETLRPVAPAPAPEALEVAPLVVEPIAVPEIDARGPAAPGGANEQRGTER
jgi:hypothetical protein